MSNERYCKDCFKTSTQCNIEGVTLWGMGDGTSQCNDCREIEIEAQIANFQESEPDTDYTNNITCPHCGHEDQDSWEHGDSDDEMQCGHCFREFSMERHVEITYSTKKP